MIRAQSPEAYAVVTFDFREDRVAQRGDGCLARRSRCDARGDAVDSAAQLPHQDLFLRGEVAEEGPSRDSRRCGDVVDRHGVVAVLCEQPECGLLDLEAELRVPTLEEGRGLVPADGRSCHHGKISGFLVIMAVYDAENFGRWC